MQARRTTLPASRAYRFRVAGPGPLFARGTDSCERYLESMSSHRRAAYDRVLERRRAVALASHFREVEGLSIAQIADRLGRSPATIKAYFYGPDGEKAHAVKARYQGYAAAAAPPPKRATARATPTNTARPAIPARSRERGHAIGCAKRCASGERNTANCRPHMTGHAPTRGREAARPWHDFRTATGRRRPPSQISTAPGRPHTPTRSQPAERLATAVTRRIGNAIDVHRRRGTPSPSYPNHCIASASAPAGRTRKRAGARTPADRDDPYVAFAIVRWARARDSNAIVAVGGVA